MNDDAFNASDDPALLLPRVLDVHGSLLRLGFTLCKGRGFVFYRQFVPLFRSIDPPKHPVSAMRKRKISHVSLVVKLDLHGDDTTRIYANYGYPERYKKKEKMIEHFVDLNSLSASTNISFNMRDDRLRDFEKTIKTLVTCLTTKLVDCTVERDSITGIVKVTIPEHEALHQAVGSALQVGLAHHKEDGWWSEESDPKADPHYSVLGVKSGRISSRSPNLSRLPSHDRRRLIRSGVRRPV